MALFMLCIKVHLKSAMNEDLWHCGFSMVSFIVQLCIWISKGGHWPHFRGKGWMCPGGQWKQWATDCDVLAGGRHVHTTPQACRLALHTALPCAPGCGTSSCPTRQKKKAVGPKGVINVLAHGISSSFIPSDPEWGQGFRIHIYCSVAWMAELLWQEGCRNPFHIDCMCQINNPKPNQTEVHWSIHPVFLSTFQCA